MQNCVLVCNTPQPSSVTQPSPTTSAPTTAQPVAQSLSTFVIYDESLTAGWSDYSYKGTYDFSNTLESHSGAVSLQANLNGWGAVNLKTDSPGFALSDLGTDANANNVHLNFWAKAPGSVYLRVRVNGIMYNTLVDSQDEWVEVSLSLHLFESPTHVYQIEIQNKSSGNIIIFFDEIELHKNGFV